ncbi:MAG: OmpA family protein [Steroidobacteraceae bacterium]
MKKSSLFAAATLAALAAAGAQAGAPVGSYYIAPEGLWVNPDNDIAGAREDTNFHVALGTALSQGWDAELGYAETNHDSPQVGKVAIRGVDLTFNRVFNRDGAISPFIGFGITALTTKFRDTNFDSNNPGGKLGAGLTADLFGGQSWKVQLLGEAGSRLDKIQRIDGLKWDTYAGLGLRLAFGGAAPVVAAAPLPAPPPAPVVAAPPAPPAPVAAPPAPPLDSDHDGVPDSADRCPNTPAGDKVDAVGCGLTVKLEVNFDTNSATIRPDSYGELDRFVQFLNEVPSAHGTLEGHTDSVGSDAYNLKLSQARADAVKAYVVGKGVSGSRLETRGYGESQPVADNKTADGRAQNRRVQFVRTSLQQ